MKLSQSDLNRTKRYKSLRRKQVRSNFKSVIKLLLFLVVLTPILIGLITIKLKPHQSYIYNIYVTLILDILIILMVYCIVHICIRIKFSLLVDQEVVQPNVNSDIYWVKKDFIIFTQTKNNSNLNKVFISYYKLPDTQAKKTSYITLTNSDFNKYNKQLTTLLKGKTVTPDTFFKSVTRKLTTQYKKDHLSYKYWGTQLAERLDKYIFEDPNSNELLIKL